MSISVNFILSLKILQIYVRVDVKAMTELYMNLDDSKLNEGSHHTKNKIGKFNRNVFWEHSKWEQSLVQPFVKSEMAFFQIEVKHLFRVDIRKEPEHYDKRFDA